MGTPWFTASCPSRSYRYSHRGTGTGLVPEVTPAGLCCASCSSGGGTMGHVLLHPGMTPELMPVSRWTLISKKPPNLPAAPAVVRLLPRDTWGSNAQPCSLLQNQGKAAAGSTQSAGHTAWAGHGWDTMWGSSEAFTQHRRVSGHQPASQVTCCVRVLEKCPESKAPEAIQNKALWLAQWNEKQAVHRG